MLTGSSIFSICSRTFSERVCNPSGARQMTICWYPRTQMKDMNYLGWSLVTTFHSRFLKKLFWKFCKLYLREYLTFLLRLSFTKVSTSITRCANLHFWNLDQQWVAKPKTILRVKNKPFFDFAPARTLIPAIFWFHSDQLIKDLHVSLFKKNLQKNLIRKNSCIYISIFWKKSSASFN